MRRRTRLVVLATAVTLVLLAGAAGWLVLGSSVLGARTVEVVGESRLSADEVVARAEVPAGTPLARLDTGAIADRVAGLAPVLRVVGGPGLAVDGAHHRGASGRRQR